jgi:small subunit ribosomal protein S6
MSNRIYESAVLINAALEDEQIQSIISHIKEIIVNSGGEIKDVEDWGRKRLAYMVKKSKIGYYAIFRFYAPPNIITKLERYYKLDESILRFLTISLSQNALEQIEKNISNTEGETVAEIKVEEDIVFVEAEENFDKPSETAINS